MKRGEEKKGEPPKGNVRLRHEQKRLDEIVLRWA